MARVSLSEFTVVYMSYDEPWADDAWADLQALCPGAKRVHGVKGLNACHVAAADAADAPWFITIDADTRLWNSFRDVSFPEAYLNPAFRLDWQSRNSVNGIVSGNGSLKLWPQELARKMRSHEAAPGDTVSLDADIGQIQPGQSRLVLMPGCHSETDPAQTSFHAFRAGFRETSFLSWLLRRMKARDDVNTEELTQILAIWCSLGRQARHGDWMIYGARLGLWAETTWSNWDIRATHDYNWFRTFWTGDILARIGPGGGRCALTGVTWNADRLQAEIAALGTALAEVSDVAVADLDREVSQTMVEARLFPAMRALENIDSLGRAFQKGRGVPTDIGIAEGLFRDAGILQHPSALSNLARLHQLKLVKTPDPVETETLFRQAMALGCAFAPYHLASHLSDMGGSVDQADLDRLIDLSAERGFAPEEATA